MMIMTKRLLVHNAIMIWGLKTNIIYHDDVLVLLLVSHLPDLLKLCLVLWVSESKKASGCLWLFSGVCFCIFQRTFFISFSENFFSTKWHWGGKIPNCHFGWIYTYWPERWDAGFKTKMHFFKVNSWYGVKPHDFAGEWNVKTKNHILRNVYGKVKLIGSLRLPWGSLQQYPHPGRIAPLLSFEHN